MNRILNTRTVLIIAIALSSIAVLRQNLSTQLIVTAVALILLLLQRERQTLYNRLFGRVKHLGIAIMTIMILQILFRREGDVLAEFLMIRITVPGIINGLSVGMRLLNLILIAGLLFDISSSEYMLAFKAWKIPFEISFLVTTVIRFIPDYYRLFLAYKETLYLRNIDLKALSIRSKLSALVSLLIPALTTNLAEVRYRAIALDLKGFRHTAKRTHLYEAKLSIHDYLIQLLTLLGFLFLLLYL